MKKLFASLLTCTLLLSMAACGNNGTANEDSPSPSVTSEPAVVSSEVQQESSTPVESEAPSSSSQEESSEPDSESDSSEDIQQSQVAASSAASSEASQTETSDGKALVVYFSATGNTKSVAEALAELQGADLYEIVPEQPYTEADLNYNDSSTRATVEQNDAAARPAISGDPLNIADYDIIYVGFPIWWGDMPRIFYTFFDTYDLSGKTIAPFCTSSGSGISRAVQAIEELEPSATVTDGLKTSASSAANDLSTWLNSADLAA